MAWAEEDLSHPSVLSPGSSGWPVQSGDSQGLSYRTTEMERLRRPSFSLDLTLLLPSPAPVRGETLARVEAALPRKWKGRALEALDVPLPRSLVTMEEGLEEGPGRWGTLALLERTWVRGWEEEVARMVGAPEAGARTPAMAQGAVAVVMALFRDLLLQPCLLQPTRPSEVALVGVVHPGLELGFCALGLEG